MAMGFVDLLEQYSIYHDKVFLIWMKKQRLRKSTKEGFHQFWYLGGVRSTVSRVLENLTFKITEGLDQNWCFPGSALLAVSDPGKHQFWSEPSEILNLRSSNILFFPLSRPNSTRFMELLEGHPFQYSKKHKKDILQLHIKLWYIIFQYLDDKKHDKNVRSPELLSRQVGNKEHQKP